MSIEITYLDLPEWERNNMRILLASPGMYQLCQRQIESMKERIVAYNRDDDVAAIGAMYRADRVQLDFWIGLSHLCEQAAREIVKS